MNYQQEYIKDEYLELKMPAGTDSDGRPTFQLDPNHLHIWPRHSFMLIALPNKVRQPICCTLFAPAIELDRLRRPDQVLTWFKSHFPDAVRAIGEKRLVDGFLSNPRSPLICTKASPYHYKDRAIILGDAAHSMVPFYGQGLNAGLEDVRILTTLLDDEGVASKCPILVAQRHNHDRRLGSALQRYSDTRHEDLIAINELAMENYAEMRHKVTQSSFVFWKTLDNLLYSLTSPETASLSHVVPSLAKQPYPPGKPKGWLPLYTMVTFRPDINYATARSKAKCQTAMLTRTVWIGVAALGVAAGWLAWSTRKR